MAVIRRSFPTLALRRPGEHHIVNDHLQSQPCKLRINKRRLLQPTRTASSITSTTLNLLFSFYLNTDHLNLVPSRQDALDRVHDSGRQQRIITKWRLPALPFRSPSRQRQHSRRSRPPGQPREQRRLDEYGRQGTRSPYNSDDGARKDPVGPSPDKDEDIWLLPSRHCHPDCQRMFSSATFFPLFFGKSNR